MKELSLICFLTFQATPQVRCASRSKECRLHVSEKKNLLSRFYTLGYTGLWAVVSSKTETAHSLSSWIESNGTLRPAPPSTTEVPSPATPPATTKLVPRCTSKYATVSSPSLGSASLYGLINCGTED